MPPDDFPQEKLQLLRTTPVFAGLQDDSYIRLANASKIVTIEKGSFLFYQRDPADALYIVKSGELDVVLSNIDGREMIIDKLSIGDCFGEVALLASGTRTAGVQARKNSDVLEIKGVAFLSVLDLDTSLARRMLEIATQRLFKSQKRESALAFLDAPARLARVLLEMDETDRNGPDKGYITLSQDELAHRAGLTRQTVTTILSRWRRHGLLLTGRGRIMLLNRPGIEQIHQQSLL